MVKIRVKPAGVKTEGRDGTTIFATANAAVVTMTSPLGGIAPAHCAESAFVPELNCYHQ
tara:strand:- start:5169 stop:5345 length:177 start_codon:yes stop_codon:yes gene_type:complete